MSELTENITIPLERYDELRNEIYQLKNEVKDFRRLFEIRETGIGLTAVVQAEQLQNWAKKNIGKRSGLFKYESAKYLTITQEDTR